MSCRPHLSVVACFLLFGSLAARGAEFRADDRPTVEADEVIDDDLYIFGEEVTIDGTVKGDLIAFGRVIRVNGDVEGDLIAAGQAVVVAGNVGDDVRVAGQVLRIDGAVGDDLIAAGFSLELTKGSSVGGELLLAGYQALVAGDVTGDFKGGMANCEITGHVGGDVKLSVDRDEAGARAYTASSPPPVAVPDVPPGLTIGKQASIDGALSYEAPREADVAEGATIAGDVDYRPKTVKASRPPTPMEKAIDVARRYGTLLIIGLCVVLVAPRWTRRLSDNVGSRPLISLVLGIVGIAGFVLLLLVIPVAMVAVAVLAGFVQLDQLIPVVIVLGITSAVTLVVGFWFFTCYLAEIIVSVFAGRWLLGRGKSTLGDNRFLTLIVGIVLLALLASVPYLGLVVGWLCVLLGLGALVLWLVRRNPDSAAA